MSFFKTRKKRNEFIISLIPLTVFLLIVSYIEEAPGDTWGDRIDYSVGWVKEKVGLESEEAPEVNGAQINALLALDEDYEEYIKEPNDNYRWLTETGLSDEQQALAEGWEDGSWYEYVVDVTGRPTQATAIITNDSLPTGKREQFSSSVRVGGELVDGYYDADKETWRSDTRNDKGNPISNNAEMQLIGYRGWLYNKSHLIAWSLGGSNLSENLVLGTRAQNVGVSNGSGGMAAIEAPTRDALKNNPDVVIFYQAVPVYKDDEIIPRGVYGRAYSVNDNGATLDKSIYTYNYQNGVEIDYHTGDWEITDDQVELIRAVNE